MIFLPIKVDNLPVHCTGIYSMEFVDVDCVFLFLFYVWFTHSLMMCGCLKSLRFWISRLIFPTTSRLRIFCLLRIFTATLCPVSWCSPTVGQTHTHTHINEDSAEIASPAVRLL